MGCQSTGNACDLAAGLFEKYPKRDSLSPAFAETNPSAAFGGLVGQTRVVTGPWAVREIRDIHADKVVVVVAGCVDVVIDKERRVVHAGETFVIPQGAAASYHAVAVNRAKMVVLTVPATVS